MMLASLFALALAVQDAPAAEPAAQAAPQPAADALPPLPAGAPSDDYGLVAWCHGALAGHMALYKMVQPELQSLAQGRLKQAKTEKERESARRDAAHSAELDKEQLAAGRDYLNLYERAIAAAEKASPQPIHTRGAEMDARGRRIWAPVQTADPRTRMWSWLNWELPGRCEIAAQRLEQRAGLLGQALRGGIGVPPAQTSETPAADDPSSAPQDAAPAPAPAPQDAAPVAQDTAPAPAPAPQDAPAAEPHS